MRSEKRLPADDATHHRTEARRIMNEAQIRGEAGNAPPPQDGGLSQQTSVTVFFVGQLAQATDGFFGCAESRWGWL